MSAFLFSFKKQCTIALSGFLVLSFLLLAPLLSIAQGPPGPGDDGSGQIPEQGVPLEGADVLLIAMGIGFVVFKLWQHNRKTNVQA